MPSLIPIKPRAIRKHVKYFYPNLAAISNMYDFLPIKNHFDSVDVSGLFFIVILTEMLYYTPSQCITSCLTATYEYDEHSTI